MRLLLPALLLFIATSVCQSTDDEKPESPPNPASADFPAYWDAKSWDTAEGARFWTIEVQDKDEKPSSEPSLSRPPQLNDFLDRQSEK